MSEKASKGRIPKPEKLQNHSNEGKGKEKKKERVRSEKGEEKKAMVLSFYDSYFGDRFGPKKTVGPEQRPNWRKSFQKQRAFILKPLLSGHHRDLL